MAGSDLSTLRPLSETRGTDTGLTAGEGKRDCYAGSPGATTLSGLFLTAP